MNPATPVIIQFKSHVHFIYGEIKFLTLYKMALKIKEFDVNYITAVKGKSINGLKFTNFRYKNSDKFPRNYRLWGNESRAREICKLL